MDHKAESNLENPDMYTGSQNIDCCVSMAEMLRPKKETKTENLSTITLGYLHSKSGSMKG